MKDEIEIAKKTFTDCAEKLIDCSAEKAKVPAETKIIQMPKMKLSEYLKITGTGFETDTVVILAIYICRHLCRKDRSCIIH